MMELIKNLLVPSSCYRSNYPAGKMHSDMRHSFHHSMKTGPVAWRAYTQLIKGSPLGWKQADNKTRGCKIPSSSVSHLFHYIRSLALVKDPPMSPHAEPKNDTFLSPPPN